MTKSQLWDEKARKYPRYSTSLSLVQSGTFEFLNELGVDFSGKKLIDVGCGTGVWTLHLAQKADFVNALDSSKEMLNVLAEDALGLNLKNIECLNTAFQAFYANKPTPKYDIAFVSMSPALKEADDYDAFAELAPLRIFIGWDEFRRSDFLTPIFQALGAKQKCFNDYDMERHLITKGIKYEKKVFCETRTDTKPREIAIESAMWHLNMAEAYPTKDELAAFIKDDTITETITSKMKLLVF